MHVMRDLATRHLTLRIQMTTHSEHDAQCDCRTNAAADTPSNPLQPLKPHYTFNAARDHDNREGSSSASSSAASSGQQGSSARSRNTKSLEAHLSQFK
jgi:hypothetical protein